MLRVLLLDSNAAVRSEIETLFRDLDFSVRSFGDSRLAFLHLLMHPEQIDVIALNSDGGSAFQRRVEVLGPSAAVTSSESDLGGGAEIVFPLMPQPDSGNHSEAPDETQLDGFPRAGTL